MTTLRAASVGAALAEARTCYDHLAGRLGAAVADRLLAAGREGFAATLGLRLAPR